MTPGPGSRLWRTWCILLAATLHAGVVLTAQSLSVRTDGDTLRIGVRGLRLIDRDTLARLEEGRSMRIEVELTALATRDGPAVAARRERFVVSYDLWEERFAVTHVATPPQSVSNLTREEAEAWCLGQLALPAAALAQRGGDAPFWIRLISRAVDPEPSADDESNGGFTLQTLIEALGRRRTSGDRESVLRAGPFRLTDLPRSP